MNLVAGQMQQVEDDEQRDGDAAPTHRERGVGTLNARAVLFGLIALAADVTCCRLVAPPQRAGSIDMEQDTREQNHANDPQQAFMRKQRFTDGAQVQRIPVEGFAAVEDLEISIHVRKQVGDHNQAGHRHCRFEGHRRTARLSHVCHICTLRPILRYRAHRVP